MHRIVGPDQNQDLGQFYWIRVTSYITGATLSIDGQKPIAIDSLLGWMVERGGKVFDKIITTGTITVEVGDDPREPYPGPPNGPAGAVVATAANISATNEGPLASITTGPGTKAFVSQPAVATQASATDPAIAGVRHVAKAVTVNLEANAAQADIIFNLRDGASGLGAILWTIRLALAAGVTYAQTFPLPDVFGTAGNAMTLESAAAPAATNFASVVLHAYDTV